MQVQVSSKNHLAMACVTFRKKAQRAQIVQEGRRRKQYEKPSEKKKRREQESLAKTKRMRRKGFNGFYG